MAESQKIRIAVASTLKPIDDVRMRRKIARSLSRIEDVEVHVIGFPSASDRPDNDGIVSHRLPPFKRLGLKRLWIPWKVLSLIISIRPAILIIATHELLWPALLAKMYLGSRIVYDVQENYYRNILYTDAFARIIRPLLAAYVRCKELVTRPIVDHYFLAEIGYSRELTFHRKAFTVIENKALFHPPGVPSERYKKQLVFTGTIALETGIFEAIDLASQLNAIDPEVTLVIAGFCSQRQTLLAVKDSLRESPFISLIGGGELVSHDKIVELIIRSGAGIMAYRPTPATINSLPTKLYEYLAYRLPIILPDHPAWVSLCEPYDAAIVVDWKSLNADDVYRALTTRSFYTSPPENVFWESEEKKLITVIQALLPEKRG